jgi:hypothetical protein
MDGRGNHDTSLSISGSILNEENHTMMTFFYLFFLGSSCLHQDHPRLLCFIKNRKSDGQYHIYIYTIDIEGDWEDTKRYGGSRDRVHELGNKLKRLG